MEERDDAQQERTAYYMTTDVGDILYAKKFREDVSIWGGGSKYTSRSFKLQDAMGKLYQPENAFGLSDKYRDSETHDTDVYQRYKRMDPGITPYGINMLVVAAVLEPPNPDQGIDQRVLITEDPDLREIVETLGGKTIGVDEFGKEAKKRGLVGKEELDLLVKSKKEQMKQFDKQDRDSRHKTMAIQAEQGARMEVQRQQLEERRRRRGRIRGGIMPSQEEIEELQEQISEHDERKEKRKARRFDPKDLQFR